MKRLVCLLASIVLAFALSACHSNPPAISSNDTDTTTASATQSPLEATTLHVLPYAADWAKNGLKGTVWEGCTVKAVESGHVLDKDTTAKVYLLQKEITPSLPTLSTYLAVETPKKLLLSSELATPYAADISLGDTDGDMVDEILFQCCVSVSGGWGGYSSLILKVVDNELREVFTDVSFDTGFSGQLEDNYVLKIENKYTGYSIALGGKKYASSHYDKDGNLFNVCPVMFDSFHTFEFVNWDEDAVREIECRQYSSAYSHADGVGDAVCTIKWDAKTQQFKVVDAAFKPYLYTDVYLEKLNQSCPDYSEEWTFEPDTYTVPKGAVTDASAYTILRSLAKQSNCYPHSIIHYLKDNTWEFTITDYDPTAYEPYSVDGGCSQFIVDGNSGEILLAYACE